MLTTVIGAYPKPSFLNLTDWFNTNKTDKKYPTKYYNEEINDLAKNAEDLLSLIHI